MSSDTKKKNPTVFNNTVESIKNSSTSVVRSFEKDFRNQIFGNRQIKRSGEIQPGESLNFSEVFSGERAENEKLKKQLVYERRLRKEEQILVEKRTGELKMQINAIHVEIMKVAKITPRLSQEITVAALSVSSDPSEYELSFLEKIFTFIQDFRLNIENTYYWLASANKRAVKKNRWGANYKKYGAKYLLSGEHYLSRSAG